MLALAPLKPGLSASREVFAKIERGKQPRSEQIRGRVSLRRKLFALLAAVALVSLGALAALDYYSGLKLADREALARRDSLLADLKQLLGSSVDANAQYLNQQANIVSLALEVQAAAVERELDRPPPDVPLYFAGRFDGPRAGWPPQTALERLGGAPDAIPASYAVGSVLVPDGIDAAAVRPDLLRLAATFPVLRRSRRSIPGSSPGNSRRSRTERGATTPGTADSRADTTPENDRGTSPRRPRGRQCGPRSFPRRPNS